MFRATKLKTPPAVEPLEVSDIKGWARDDSADEDAVHQSCMQTARANVEGFLNRRLITQVHTVYYDAFPLTLLIPLAPVQAVVEVRYRDLDGTWQTLDAADWEAFTISEPATVSPGFGKCWPATWPGRGSVEVDVRIGYGDAGTDVPPQFLTAIRREAAFFFESRESAGLPDRNPELLPMVFHF